jgi:hypothetical protein
MKRAGDFSQFTIEFPRRSHGYFLVSFAPSIGMGLYHAAGSAHIFDLVARIDDCVSPEYTGRIQDALNPANQIKIGIEFANLDELIRFCRREYLRDKKDTYYSMLFTLRFSKARAAKALGFLDDATLSDIPVSRIVVSVLKHEANPRHVAHAIALAHTCHLENVRRCLVSEFHEIVRSRQVTAALRRLGPNADSILRGINTYRGGDAPDDTRGAKR